MRKVVVSEFVSLDGVMENPGWTLQFESEDRDRFKFDELAAADALLLGRKTYEGFAAAWPGMAEETGEYGAWMNGYPKHVASTTLEEPLEWNASLIGPDLPNEISGLKNRPGKDIQDPGARRDADARLGRRRPDLPSGGEARVIQHRRDGTSPGGGRA